MPNYTEHNQFATRSSYANSFSQISLIGSNAINVFIMYCLQWLLVLVFVLVVAFKQIRGHKLLTISLSTKLSGGLSKLCSL